MQGNKTKAKEDIRTQLLLIIFLAFSLRMIDVSIPCHHPQPDERFSLEAATQPALRDTIRFTAADTHPPLYFIILRGWLKILPKNYDSPKLLSMIFNTANIFLTFILAQLWLNKKTALLAALVMALSPWNIYWSHLARNHQMLPVFFTLSTLALFQWLRSGGKKFPICYCIIAAIMIHTNYLAFFILASQGAIALWECRRNLRRLFMPAITACLAVASYYPYLSALKYHITEGPMNAGCFQHVVSPIYLFYHFLFFNIFTCNLGHLWYPPPSHPAPLLSGGLVLALVGIKAVKKIPDFSFYILLLLPPTLSVFIGWLKGTTMAERYLAYAIGPFAILFAAGLAEIASSGKPHDLIKG